MVDVMGEKSGRRDRIRKATSRLLAACGAAAGGCSVLAAFALLLPEPPFPPDFECIRPLYGLGLVLASLSLFCWRGGRGRTVSLLAAAACLAFGAFRALGVGVPWRDADPGELWPAATMLWTATLALGLRAVGHRRTPARILPWAALLLSGTSAAAVAEGSFPAHLGLGTVALGLGLAVSRPFRAPPTRREATGAAAIGSALAGILAATLAEMVTRSSNLPHEVGFLLACGAGGTASWAVVHLVAIRHAGTVRRLREAGRAAEAAAEDRGGHRYAGAWEWDVEADSFGLSSSLRRTLGLPVAGVRTVDLLTRQDMEELLSGPSRGFPPGRVPHSGEWLTWSARLGPEGGRNLIGRGRAYRMDGRIFVVGVAAEASDDGIREGAEWIFPEGLLPPVEEDGDPIVSLLCQELQNAPLLGPPETIRLGPVLNRVAARLAPVALQSGIDLRVVHSGLWATAEPVMLERTLQAALQGALATPGTTRVLIGARKSGDEAVVWVVRQGEKGGHASMLTVPGVRVARRLSGLVGNATQVFASRSGAERLVVRLPAAGRDAPGRLPPRYGVALLGPGTRRTALAAWLEGAGHAVLVQGEAKDADGLLRGEAVPDAIVVDCRPGHWSRCVGVVDEARKACGWDVPAVMLSGATSRAGGFAPRGLWVLSEPFGAEALLLTLDTAVPSQPWAD